MSRIREEFDRRDSLISAACDLADSTRPLPVRIESFIHIREFARSATIQERKLADDCGPGLAAELADAGGCLRNGVVEYFVRPDGRIGVRLPTTDACIDPLPEPKRGAAS